MTTQEITNVERIVRRAKEMIERNRQDMIRQGRIADEIAMTQREHEMDVWFRKLGVDGSGHAVASEGPLAFVTIIRS